MVVSVFLFERMRLAEFDEDAAGRLWVQERDQAAVGAAPRVFVDQPYASRLELGERRFDVRHAVGRVMQFRRSIAAIPRDRRVFVERKQQLDDGVPASRPTASTP